MCCESPLPRGDSIKRIVHSKSLADKWCKLGYEIITLSYTGRFGETPMDYHLENKL
ncbi:MAG: hypothetical protein E7F12_16865 [Clostridioides difficile]|nr:hypothetical protein [Clostridioides difficile]